MYDAIVSPAPPRRQSWSETALGAVPLVPGAGVRTRPSGHIAPARKHDSLPCAVRATLTRNAALARRRGITIRVSIADRDLTTEQYAATVAKLDTLFARTLASASRGSTFTCRATAEGSEILVDLTFARGGRGNSASNLVDEYWSWSAAEAATNVN